MSSATADARAALRSLEEDGYVVIEDALGPVLPQVQAELDAVLEETPFGRNDFEGFTTRRVYSLLRHVPSVAKLAEHPQVMALASELLLPGFLLSALLAIDIHPGETAQPLHFDDGFYRLPRPRPAVGLSTIWALDDFTEENGATQVVPGSHLLGDEPPSQRDAVPVVMPAGSVVVFLGTTWHGGGANRSAGARRAVTAQYCQPWARQQEQMMLAIPPDVVRACSPELQAMLGWSIFPPFMGHVGGRHPLKLLTDEVDRRASEASSSFWSDYRAP